MGNKKRPLFLTVGMAEALMKFLEDFQADFRHYYTKPTTILVKLKNLIEKEE